METDLKEICSYLDAICLNPTMDTPAIHITNPMAKNVFEKVYQIHSYLHEVYQVSTQLANGDLQFAIHKENLYAGALKDLQASLKHLVWQVGRVAEGDYNIKLDFLGDFTDSFEKMIYQLKERESTLKENVRLNEVLVQQQMQLFEGELERSAEKYDQFAKSMEEIRSYRHDMQNHLLCIDSLLQEKKYEESSQYIHSITEVFSVMIQAEKTHNYILDALLNDKIEKARLQHAKVITKIKISRKLNIENKDWCILIGNALDNSLEALAEVPENKRELTIQITNVGDMMTTKITNTMAKSVLVEDNQIKTRKADKSNHGIGLKNIRSVVAKYHGEMEVKINKDSFSLVFLLCSV